MAGNKRGLNRTSEPDSCVSKKKRMTKSAWAEKVMSIIGSRGDKKMSLQVIKQDLSETYEIDFSLPRNRTALGKTLGKCIDNEQLIKVKSSYMLKGGLLHPEGIDEDKDIKVPN